MSTAPPGTWRRFAGSLTALAGVAVLVPALLVLCSQAAFGTTHPLPGLGSAGEVRAWFERELSTTELGPVALRVLLIIGWCLWAMLMLSVASAIVRSRPKLGHVRVPHPAMFEGIAVWIATGLTVLSSLTPRVAIAAPNVQSVFAPVVQLEPSMAGGSAPTAAPSRIGFERVETGESIEMFAERTLGDGSRWTEIWELGRGEVADETTGARWTEPWRIEGGWQLRLPARPVSPISAPSVVGPTDPTAASPERTHVVEAGDSYWSIAAGVLEQRFDRVPTDSEVAALVALLIDRNAPQLGYDDPAMIRPGDRVATGVEFDLDVVEPGVHRVAAGDSYWSIAESELAEGLGRPPTPAETAEFTAALMDHNAQVLGYDDPAMIQPGDRMDTALGRVEVAPEAPLDELADEPVGPAPEVVEEEPTPEAPAVEQTDDVGPDRTEAVIPPPTELVDAAPWNPPVGSPSPESPDVPDEPEKLDEPVPVDGDSALSGKVGVLAGLSVLSAAGVAGLIRTRRRRAAHRVRSGQRLAPLSDASRMAVMDVLYRNTSDVEWMDLELRLLSLRLERAAREVMTIQLVQLGKGRSLEVAFVEIPPVAPVEGWTHAADRVWRLDEPHDQATLSEVADAPPVAPCLVTLGERDDRGQLYLNAEAPNGIYVTGDAEAVEGWVSNAVLEIASGAVGEEPDLRLVSGTHGAPSFSALDAVRHVSEQDAIHELAEALDDDPAASDGSMLAKRTGKWEAWPATTIVLTDVTHDDRWAKVAATPCMTVISTAEPFEDGLTIRIDVGEISVPALGVSAKAPGLSTAEVTAITEVLEDLDADPIDDHEFIAVPTSGDPPSTEVETDWEPPSWPVMINLLGTPNATRNGAPLRLTPQQLSALALIAIKRKIPAHDFKRAIWGDEDDVTPERVRDMLSVLRKKVGGLSVIPRREDGLVCAGAGLGSDVLVFDALAARTRQAPDELVPRLHEMLDLVTGRPFDYASADQAWWRWSEISLGSPDWVRKVSAASECLARLHLERSDPTTAQQVAEKGLSAEPLNEALTQVLMVSYADRGAHDAAQRVFQSLDRALAMADLGGATDETRALLERILARSQ